MSKNWDKGEEITAEGLNDQGLKVAAQDPADMTLHVFPGVAIVDGTIVKYAGGDTGSFSAPASNPRIDIVSIDAGGTINITQGVEAGSPTAPAYPSDETVLAEIYLRVGCTEILNADDASEAYIYRDSRPLGAGITLIDETAGAADAGKGIKTDADGLLDPSFLRAYRTMRKGSAAAIDGSTTPKAVCMLSDGTITQADADGGSTQKFIGFVKEALAGFFPGFEYGLSSNSSTQSLTIPAGSNLMLIVAVGEYSSGSLPSGFTFNGVAMTASISQGSDTATGKFWYLPLGTLASPLTANLVYTGGIYDSYFAAVYDNVDQASPLQTTQVATNGTDPTVSLSGYQTVVVACGGGNSVSVSNSGFTSRYTSGGAGLKLFGDYQANGSHTLVWGAGAAIWMLALGLRTASGTPQQCDVYYSGIIDGFSGLTPGSDYYVQNTAGAIGTSAGTTTIKCGKAVSATELLIVQT